ncbi:hypothetical protein OA2633_00355 [Oceanicaulis sp. HTCC2633]|uniref:FkbM family methyltransferase n=1 Tax=Oceanicaulis sp. HTCC2633 TaxID=314254 RepID=UPI0000669A4B|nr:FkbM family methyltransferase [Oceanicaulis sp. HTCC2633]EAP89198.1 hypothetical protein OA2633_00355 [Oceanicaulis sp. HTCC2633]
MTETSSNPDQAALETDETLAIPPASDGLVRSRGGPVAHEPPAPDYGAYAPGFVSRIGLAIGRALPASRAGLRLAGAARPLALNGVKAGVADVEALGLKLRLHPTDNLSEKRLFMTPQCFDPAELAALRGTMGPGRTFMDIGANAGAYSLVAAKAGGAKSRVIAVEPQREMRRRLSFNARQNGLGNIEMAGVALADYEGEEVMRMISGNHGQARLGGSEGEAVRVTTLLTLMDELKLKKAHAMKVDVEGGEAAILSHFFAKADKDRWPDLLILERADMADGRETQDAAALALRKGYAVRQSTRMNVILDLKTP